MAAAGSRNMASLCSWWNSCFRSLSRRTFLMVALLSFSTLSSLSASEDGAIDTESWLRQYGYLAPQASANSSSLLSIQDLSEAISDMQSFYKLEVSGQMDQPTITAMERPRCGVPDKTTNQSHYSVGDSKWDKLNITYSIENFAPNIAWYETFGAIRRAFKVWEKVSPLTFEEIPYEEIHHSRCNKADIMISFASGSHKDCGPFGRTVLAHAHYPGSGTGRDVHFNSDWQWSNTNQDVQGSINVFLVALHQIGHSLGLGHSSNKSSVMYPSYHWMETEDFQLPADDRQGIQQIYRDKSCPSGWRKFADRCYYRTTRDRTWQQSRDYCLSHQADLVVINSREEQVFIRGLNPGASVGSWIGLTRTRGRWTWRWLDRTPLTTQYWLDGGAVNLPEDMDCASYSHYTEFGQWTNWQCYAMMYAICEKLCLFSLH